MRFPRLWPRRRSSQATSGLTGESPDQITPLQQAGQLLKERREQRGLSMRDLSREVRITTPVLEALERGWADRLPEAAYLGAMLAQLERHLELAPDSLQGALPTTTNSKLQGKTAGNRRFTIGSIDIVSTWQGSVVYGVVMLGTLMALNQQQRHLAQRNSQQLQPIAPTAADLQISNRTQGSETGLPPGLRPLEDALRRPLVQWLPPTSATSKDSQAIDSDERQALGLLQLNLSQPSTIRLSSAGGDRSELQGSQGQLTLQLLAPISLNLQPPPQAEDQVLWNGQPQKPMSDQPGRYRLPQSDPRSP
nr:helix-turn-helix transcriptional regulator [Synechococcus sp. UW140]